MNILFIESSSGGHYVSLHLKSIIDEFKNNNINLYFLISSETLKSESFKKIKNIKKENIFIFKKPKTPHYKKKIFFLINQIIYYFNLKASFNKIEKKIDFIHINTLDHFDKALAIFNTPFGDIPFSGQLNHPTFHLSKMGIKIEKKPNLINSIFFNLLMNTKNLKKIFTIDPLLQKYLKKIKNNNYKKIKILPVTANLNLKNKYLKTFNLNKIFNKKDYFILVYGAIKESKNIISLIKSINKVNLKNIKIIIGGKIDIKFKKKLMIFINVKKKISKNIFLFDKYLSEGETTILFKKCNLIWLCYKKEHFTSSSVLIKAGMNKKKIIACNHGLVKFFNKKYKLGPEIDPDNDHEIIESITKMYQKKYNYPINSKKFIKYNNPSIIGKLILEDTLNYF